MARSVLDAVSFAGGWLLDHVMAGWDATVIVADGCDYRPLRILGADTLDCEAGLKSIRQLPRLQTLAVSSDLVGHDSRVRRVVLTVLNRGRTKLIVWDENGPARLEPAAGSMQHRLSAAARVFKAHALAAAAAPEISVGHTETFRCGALMRRKRLGT